MSGTAQLLSVLRERGPDRPAESALLGEWLLARAGIDGGAGEAGEVTIVPEGVRGTLVLRDGQLNGTARRVPWAREAAQVAVLLDGLVLTVNRQDVVIEPRANLAGDARDTVVFVEAPVRSAGGVDAQELLLRGALSRIALMAGALERVYEIAIGYASDRRQFGRPIGSFQAVQQHLVTIAQQTALVSIAADSTARDPGSFEIAAAKLLANRAALIAGRAAHQVLGARGTTREHPLGQLTSRLWAWRSEYGDEHYWSTRLGAAIAREGADHLYPAITGGSSVASV